MLVDLRKQMHLHPALPASVPPGSSPRAGANWKEAQWNIRYFHKGLPGVSQWLRGTKKSMHESSLVLRKSCGAWSSLFQGLLPAKELVIEVVGIDLGKFLAEPRTVSDGTYRHVDGKRKGQSAPHHRQRAIIGVGGG